jgi:putative ABC transport system permease protein
MFYAVDGEGHPRYFDFSLTPRLVLAALAASIAAGCLFSALPAFSCAISSGGCLAARASTGRWRSGRWLLGAQAAIAVGLVAVAALLATSASLAVNGSSLEASHVALMRLRPRLMKYPPEARAVVPARRRAAAGGGAGCGIGEHGRYRRRSRRRQHSGRFSELDKRSADRAGYNEIGPRYFETLRMPMLSGREFDDRDGLQSPRVAIVNETLARRLWPNSSPIGATIVARNVLQQVVGVVADVRIGSRTEAVAPFVYTPFWQNPQQVDRGLPSALPATRQRRCRR